MLRKFDHLQALPNTNLKLSDVVVQIRYVQGSDLNNAAATTRLVVRLLIEPERRCSNVSRSPNTGDKTQSVMVVTTVNPKIFGDNLYLNTIPATKFYFDTNLPAIRKFTASLGGAAGEIGTLSSPTLVSRCEKLISFAKLGLLRSSTRMAGRSLLAPGATEVGQIWHFSSLQQMRFSQRYRCYQRFRVELSVDDGNDNATFVVFDMEKTKLTKRDAADMGHEL
ncbi:PREDICTED: uncharacterized protein LOC106303515 isoform X3 [Brassica oleracea var. oleracea]|nr:PREDICTED: uncharacterized protein LOC106303515 isoform X3 [Brassica oleracea var. oleracea]